MASSNQTKADLLGMPFGTANGRLKKTLLYTFAGQLGLLDCYRCGSHIENEIEFSIEHKKSWMYSQTPIQTFFDLDNISFSHVSCNVAAAARPGKLYGSSSERKRAAWDRLDKDAYAVRRKQYPSRSPTIAK